MFHLIFALNPRYLTEPKSKYTKYTKYTADKITEITRNAKS